MAELGEEWGSGDGFARELMMSAPTVSHGMRLQEWLGEGWSLPAETCPSLLYFKLLGFSDTEKDQIQKRASIALIYFTYVYIREMCIFLSYGACAHSCMCVCPFAFCTAKRFINTWRMRFKQPVSYVLAGHVIDIILLLCQWCFS